MTLAQFSAKAWSAINIVSFLGLCLFVILALLTWRPGLARPLNYFLVAFGVFELGDVGWSIIERQGGTPFSYAVPVALAIFIIVGSLRNLRSRREPSA